MKYRFSIGLFRGVAPVLAFSLLIAVFACRHQQLAEKWHLTPPIAKLDPAFTEFDLDAGQGAVFNLPSGTTIQVPASALVDSTGASITGRALLRYREFHNTPEIFLSGIPMAYSESGDYKVLETAGMFEIRATQNGHCLKIADNKNITVKLASASADTGYNIFALDENTGSWQLTGDSKAEKSEQKELLLNEKLKLEKEAAALKDKGYFVASYVGLLDAVYGPKVATEDRYNKAIRRKVDNYGIEYCNFSAMVPVKYKGETEYAELMLWKNLSGKKLPNFVGDNNFYANYQFKQGDEYIMTVYNTNQTPVYKGLVQVVVPLRLLFKTDTMQWYKDYRLAQKKADSVNQLMVKMYGYTRTVMAGNFGVHNCDAYVNRSDRVDVAASVDFDQQPGPDLKSRMNLYFLGSDKKTVVNWMLSDLDGHYKIVMVPDSSARIFTLYPDGYAAIMSREDFKKLDLQALLKPGANCERALHLKRASKPINTAKDLTDLLGS